MKYIFTIFLCKFIVFNVYAAENSEELLRHFIWNSSYPVETVSIMYYENFIPGDAYDGQSTFETVRVVHDDELQEDEQLGDQLSESELVRFYTHTRVRKLFIDYRENRNWIRLDSIWIPNDRRDDSEYINLLFSKPQILIDGPKGSFRYESGYQNGMIHRELKIKHPKIWRWGLMRRVENRERRITDWKESATYSKIEEMVSRNLQFADFEQINDNIFKLTLTPLFYIREFTLKKDWNYLPTKAVYKRNDEIQREYEITERSYYAEDNYYFPTKAVERHYVYENGQNFLNYELQIEVIDYNIWCDIPEAIFTVPFENGTRVIDMSNAVENRQPDRRTWTDEESEDFIREIDISKIDKIDYTKNQVIENTEQVTEHSQVAQITTDSSTQTKKSQNTSPNRIEEMVQSPESYNFSQLLLYAYILLSPLIIIGLYHLYKKHKK